MGTWLSRAESALLLLAPKQFVSLSWRSGDTSLGSAAPSSEHKCISNNELLWGLTEMDVLKRGVGGKAGGKCRSRFAWGSSVPCENRLGRGEAGCLFQWGPEKQSLCRCTANPGLNRAVLMVVAILSYVKKSMNKHTISLKSRWGFFITDTGYVHHNSLFLL